MTQNTDGALESPPWKEKFGQLKGKVEDAHCALVTSRQLFATLKKRQNEPLLQEVKTAGMWIFHFNEEELDAFLNLLQDRPTDVSTFLPTFRMYPTMTDRFTALPKLMYKVCPDCLTEKTVERVANRASFISREHTIFPSEWKENSLDRKQTILLQVAAYTIINSSKALLFEKHSAVELNLGGLIYLPSPLTWCLPDLENCVKEGEGSLNCLIFLKVEQVQQKSNKEEKYTEKEEVLRKNPIFMQGVRTCREELNVMFHGAILARLQAKNRLTFK